MINQILVLIIATIVSLGILLKGVNEFTKRKIFVATVSFPFVMFTIGFSMRLSKIQDMIDLGYYLTDISFLFVYSLFAIALMLGQIKYWKKN